MFRAPVGGLQTGTREKGEEELSVALQVRGETLVGRRVVMGFQEAIQVSFQPATGDGQAWLADLPGLPPVAQLRSEERRVGKECRL